MVILLHSSGFPYRFLNPSITGMDVVNWLSTTTYAAVGLLGVPLFVMLTGVLLLDPNRENESLRVFYKKRLNRIGWPFIFWTVVYFAWSFGVLEQPLTLMSVLQGLASGAYAHLWYLYLLMGLYALTPVLRVLVKHLDRKLYKYLLIIWFAGTTLTPAVHTFLPQLNFYPYPFILIDWIGYYLLGLYLIQTSMPKSKAFLIMLGGLLGTVASSWLITGTLGEQYTGFFHSYVSPTIILASAGLFFALMSLDFNRLGTRRIGGVIHWVSQNTLPIYLIHMIILVTLVSYGVFGFWVNSITDVVLLDVPIFAVIVFALSAGIVFVLKKVPGLAKFIG